MWNRERYEQQRQALELLSIDVSVWETLTPEARKEQFKTTIKKGWMTYHPDKGGNNDSFRLVKAIDYNYGAIYPQPRASMPYTADLPSAEKEDERWFNKEDTADARYYRKAFSALEREANELLRSPKYVETRLQAGDLEFWNYHKEKIVNFLKPIDFQTMCRIPRIMDFRFVTEVAVARQILAGYSGRDEFASALVSKEPARIKATFDLMVTSIKNSWSLMSFFSPQSQRVEQFVDLFCHFNQDIFKNNFIGAETVLLLSRALSLDLPYESIKSPYEATDTELVRTALSIYVMPSKQALSLSAGSVVTPQ